ncbi:hypothetical protein N1030_16600 [Desulfovibrio mangrovi]|uniref:hypothetical protein n=1 Tax=Desulfovibrio mangrovi TaxID=2976983 RepID=UPI0022485FF9|nr:hypothetical protein [Desulfovibrio mangrovi]UZP67195.1 hypothetical protein N1030_16600 [Desulfovibrio mangrovi]
MDPPKLAVAVRKCEKTPTEAAEPVNSQCFCSKQPEKFVSSLFEPFVVVVAEKWKIVKTGCHKTAKYVNLLAVSSLNMTDCNFMNSVACHVQESDLKKYEIV